MEELTRRIFTGERALFCAKDLLLAESVFDDGESPLKESENIQASSCLFRWKYPFWYAKNIAVKDCTFFENARAGIWYTEDISLTNCTYLAPKGLRRCKNISLNGVTFSDAKETLWNCRDISMKDVTVKGDYFAMNCENMQIDRLELIGNYGFDGAKNVVIRNSKLLTKDAFWNCENITVYDSFISGEYFAWNSKNVTLINCMVESLQGFCYMKNVTLKKCKLVNTTLSFEYAENVDAEIFGKIDSVKNPTSGKIVCDGVDELILDEFAAKDTCAQVERRK